MSRAVALFVFVQLHLQPEEGDRRSALQVSVKGAKFFKALGYTVPGAVISDVLG